MLNSDEVPLHMNQLTAALCGTEKRINFVFYSFWSLTELLLNDKWITFTRKNNF